MEKQITLKEMKDNLSAMQYAIGGEAYARIDFEDGESLAIEFLNANEKSSYEFFDNILEIFRREDLTRKECLHAIELLLEKHELI